jgi:hypothetical protein
MAWLFGTGLEVGSTSIFSEVYGNLGVTGSNVHTGTYCLALNGGYNTAAYAGWNVPGSITEFYVGVWVRPNFVYNPDGLHRVRIVLTDGTALEARINSSHKWDLYVNNSKVADGVAGLADTTWSHLQLHVSIANSDGRFASKVDGAADASFTGDTEPGTGNSIAKVQLYIASDSAPAQFDDLAIRDDDWTGDIRFDKVAVVSDDGVEWTPSTGAYNYAVVDEVPPDDGDYVSVEGAGYRDLYGVESWTSEGKTPMFVVDWAKAKQDGSAQVRLLDTDGVNERLGSAMLPSPSGFGYLMRVLETQPDGVSAWTASAIQSLGIGQESA